MKAKRRQLSARFKFRVALEAARGLKSTNQVWSEWLRLAGIRHNVGARGKKSTWAHSQGTMFIILSLFGVGI